MYSRFKRRLQKACGRKVNVWSHSPTNYKEPTMDFSEIRSLSDKRRVTNEEQSWIPLQPIVFCYGKYLSSSFAFVDSLKSDVVRATRK